MFCLANVAHWVYRFTQAPRNLLEGLWYSVGYYFQLHARFASLVGRWHSGIVFLYHTYLHHRRCNVSTFTPLLVLGSVNRSPWCDLFFWRMCLILWYKRPALVILNVGCCGIWMKNSLPSWLLYVIRWCFCTNKSDRMLSIPFGLYQTGFEYPGRSPILLVYVSTSLQWAYRYCQSEAYLMFDRYLTLMKALHVDWLSRRHPFSSMLSHAASARIISTTRIILSLRLLCDKSY